MLILNWIRPKYLHFCGFCSSGEIKESISEDGALMKHMCLKFHRIIWTTLCTVLEPILDKNDVALKEVNTAYTYISHQTSLTSIKKQLYQTTLLYLISNWFY
jgi:hypothetical protein